MEFIPLYILQKRLDPCCKSLHRRNPRITNNLDAYLSHFYTKTWNTSQDGANSLRPISHYYLFTLKVIKALFKALLNRRIKMYDILRY